MDVNDALDWIRDAVDDAARWRSAHARDQDPRLEIDFQRTMMIAAVGALLAHVGPAPAPPQTEVHEASPES